MATIYRIEDFRFYRGAGAGEGAICQCDAHRAAHEVLCSELAELRRTIYKPLVLCLENLESGVPGGHDGWDFIYSSKLLTALPFVAARQVVKTAVSRLKPGGRLLLANLLADAPAQLCARCQSMGKNRRGELEMVQLAEGIPFANLSGQAVFRDRENLNVFLELHRSFDLPSQLDRARAVAR